MAEAAAPPEEPASGETSEFPVFRADGERLGTTGSVKVAPMDFRNPTLLPESEMRRLRGLHQDYLRALSARLAGLLRAELVLTLANLTTQPYEPFIESLKNPTQIALFRVAPLVGIGLIEIAPPLARALTNRMLGGRDQAAEAEACLTEIEVALLEDVIAIFLSEWCDQWKDQIALEPHFLTHETNPRFVQLGSRNSMMLVLSIDAAFGEVTDKIVVAVPLSMVEPILKRIQTARSRDSSQPHAATNPAWRSAYNEISIPLYADVIATDMSIATLLDLRIGSTIELPATALDQVRIEVAGMPAFTGRAGQSNGRVVVQIETKAAQLPALASRPAA